MKFLHLGDLHIGKSLGDFDLIRDQRYILEQIMEIIEEKKVDALLLAGDIYDKPIPSEAAVRLLDEFFCKLAQRKIKTFVISGNHDSDERLNFASSLLESQGIYICTRYQGELYKRTLTDEYGTVNIYLLPFLKASTVRKYFEQEEIKTYDDAMRVVLKQAKIDPEQRNMIVAHQFVISGDNETKLGGSESAGTQNVGLVEQISKCHFEIFDYTALGHIHRGQQIGMETIRYSGSPLKYSLSEAGHEKTAPVITLGRKGSVEIESVKLRPERDLRHIKGKMAALLDSKHITDPEDYIYATLTDEDLISDAMNIFQQYYPHTVRIDYDNSHTKEMKREDLEIQERERSFTEMIGEFYQQMYQCEISEEEMKLMEEIAREAGVEE